MRKRYWFPNSPFDRHTREKNLRLGFEVLIRFFGARSSEFTCYCWKDSGVPHQDATAKELLCLKPFITWNRSAPEFSENGFVIGGSVTPAMIEALLQAPHHESLASPIFALKLEQSGVVILDYGDYADNIIFKADHEEIQKLQKLFSDADLPFFVGETRWQEESA